MQARFILTGRVTEAIKNGEPDNEETELKAEKLVEFLWENYGD